MEGVTLENKIVEGQREDSDIWMRRNARVEVREGGRCVIGELSVDQVLETVMKRWVIL